MRVTQTGGDGRMVRRYEYEDSWVVVADLVVDDARVDVDVVGETAIVVIERADDVIETEFDVPGPAANVTTNNGVLCIEGHR